LNGLQHGAIEIPSLEVIRAERQRRRIERARESFRDFIRLAWAQVDPHTLVDGWYLDALAEHFQAVSAGQIRQLVVNIPPRFAKSTIGSVLWPAWDWLQDPSRGWLTASHSHNLAIRDAVKARRLIESPWYREAFGVGWALQADQNAKGRYDNTEKGYRLVTSVEAKTTGDGGDITLCDDPLDARDAYSPAAIETCRIWWKEVWSSRVNDPRTSRRVLVMQRIHEQDPAGECLTDPGWERLILPQEYSPSVYVTALGWTDPRTEPGELLCEERMGPVEVAAAKRSLGPAYEGQHNQRPTPPGGRMIKRAWIQRYDETPRAMARRCEKLIQTWDCTFTDAEGSDWVVGNVWGFVGADACLLARVREKLDLPGTCEAIRRLTLAWPAAAAKYVERRANGHGVISSMRREVPGLIAWPPEGSEFAQANKMQRVAAVLPYFQAGNVWLPTEPWADEVEEEWCRFPLGSDDQVDAMTMALIAHYLEGDGEGPTVWAVE